MSNERPSPEGRERIKNKTSRDRLNEMLSREPRREPGETPWPSRRHADWRATLELRTTLEPLEILDVPIPMESLAVILNATPNCVYQDRNEVTGHPEGYHPDHLKVAQLAAAACTIVERLERLNARRP